MSRQLAFWLCVVGLPIGAQQPRAKVILPGFRAPVWMDTTGQSRTLDAPAGTVMDAVAAVFSASELPMEVRDDRALILGSFQVKTQRRFAGERLSQLLDCGVGTRGPNADAYRVHLALVALLTVQGEKTQLRVAFAAGAQDFAGPLADPVSCSSTGRLETRVLDAVEQMLRR
jgi:hypothetical protein